MDDPQAQAEQLVMARWNHWRPGDWTEDIEHILRNGLTPDDVAESIWITQRMPRQNYWKYFMGVCRNKIKEAAPHG